VRVEKGEREMRGKIAWLGCLVALITAFLFVPSFAQDPENQVVIGAPPFSTVTDGAEQINIGNLNVSWNFPIVSTPGRGMPFHYYLTYSTGAVWKNKGGLWTGTTGLGRGWALNSTLPATFIQNQKVIQGCTGGAGGTTTDTWQNWTYIDQFGIRHPFAGAFASVNNCTGATTTSGPISSTDGSGFLLTPNAGPDGFGTITTPAGTILFGGSNAQTAAITSGMMTNMTDSNGNFLFFHAVSNGPVSMSDYLGGTVTATPGFDRLGLNPTPPYTPDKYQYIDSNGQTQTIQVTFTPKVVQTAFGCPSVSEGSSGGVTVPFTSSIIYPDGSKYSFTYEPTPGAPSTTTGRLASITLPSGGVIRYTYTGPNGGINCADGTTLGLSRQTPDGTTSYVRTNVSGTQWKTVITDPPDAQAVVNQQNVFFQVVGGAIPALLYETKRQLFQGPNTGTPLKTIFTCYNTGVPDCVATAITLPITKKIEKEHLQNGQERQKTTLLNAAGLVTETDETDWGPTAPGPLLRKVVTHYAALGNNIQDRPSDITTFDGAGNQIAQTKFSYDQTTPMSTASLSPAVPAHKPITGSRGNATTISRWIKSTGTFLSTIQTFDDTGNVLTRKDPNGNTTSFSYNDNFTDGTNRNTLVLLTKLTGPATGGASHITRSQYYFPTAQKAASCGENYPQASQCTVTAGAPQSDFVGFTYDSMNRILSEKRGDGGQDTFSYNVTSPPLTMTRNTLIASGVQMVNTTKLDGLGRASQTQLNSDPEGTDFVDTTYDGLGRKATVSNPYRSTSDGTFGAIQFTYDGLDRVTKLTQTDGSAINTQYVGNCATVTDEAGKVRKSCSDGLGRLTGVFEDPNAANLETDYFYDALDNLTCVQQRGGVSTPASTGCAFAATGDASSPWRIRRFAYDSLSRLMNATNPESGAISYTYDNNGNPITRTAPKPNQTSPSTTVVATYSYDALNRLTQKSYNDGATPTVKYGYDAVALAGCTTAPPALTASNSLGRRTAMCDGSGATSWNYDTMGRTLTQNQTIVGSSAVTLSIGYTYNFDGSVATLKYPSGKTLTYSYNAAARPISAVDSANSLNYVTGATYFPHGSLSGYVNGNSASFAGITATFGYNNRLQPVLLSAATPTQTVFSLSYGYGATGQNNGNPSTIVNNLTAGRTQTFTYDALNRVATAQSQATTGAACWGQNYGIDSWGNLTTENVTKCSAGSLSIGVDGGNHLTGGFAYDAAGNLTQEGTGTPSWTFSYDAENRLKTLGGSASATYTYDGDGQRTKMSNNGLFWRQPGGPILTKTTVGGAIIADRVYFGGNHIAIAHGTATSYLFQDSLGGEHLVTNATGVVCNDIDTLPFGGEIDYTTSCDPSYKFADMERDDQNSANLDYAINRYYDLRIGRWLTPDWETTPTDVPYASFGDPQTLNLYGYVRNNPIPRADSNGHCCDVDNVLNFVKGFANAYGSDNLAGVGRMDQPTSAGKIGAAFGDAAATVQGTAEALFGGGVEVGGLALDSTGVGAAAGVPANAAGAALIVQGTITAETGFSTLFSSAIGPKEGQNGGPGAGKSISDKTKSQALKENKNANGGQAKCVFCGEPVGKGTKNKINFDHAQAKSNGGNNSLNNTNVSCEYCNKSKGAGETPKNPKKPQQN
jgi:RHS repeat-associated protein